LKKLPTAKGFTTNDDNFNVTEKVPGLLKKKYGYDVLEFAFSEIHIVNTLDDLLLLCKPDNEKVKNLYKTSGKLSSYGESCFKNLEVNVRQRLWNESNGMDIWEMPVILDEVMIGVENVTGLNWEEGHSLEEVMSEIVKKLSEKKKEKNVIAKYEVVDGGEEMEEEGEEE
jgi:hypothetical protein